MTRDADAQDDDRDLGEPAFNAVADAILDGLPVDWTTTESGGSTDPALIRQLRVLADVVAVHRTLSQDDDALATASGPDSSMRPSWGHLQLVEKVGQGAFGEVFRAWDPHLTREVALKLLGPAGPTNAPGADDRSWVLKEARFLAAIRHPNVVIVYGADRIDGRVGFWTEFIRGRTLAEIVDERGRFSVDDAIAIGIDVCRAVSAMHQAGLLHRDIKANNVMREEGGRVVLLDFGATSNSARETAAEGTIGGPDGPTGTPLYVAPELWHGRAATPQSDVYSLGVLLYFLVTGSYPVEGATVRDVGEAHRAGRTTNLRDRQGNLPDAFLAVVDRAIALVPSTRFENISAFESALTKARETTNGIAVGHTPLWRSRRALEAAALVVVLVGFGSFAVRQWGRGGERPASPRIATPAGAATAVPQWRKIRLPGRAIGRPSHDGRFYPYIDHGDIYIWSAATAKLRRVTDTGGASNLTTLLSPNGDRVAYVVSLPDGYRELRIISADGTSPVVLVPRERNYEPDPLDWSRDGTDRILYAIRHQNGSVDLALVGATGGTIPRLLGTLEGGDPPGVWRAPDGRFISAPGASLSPDGRYLITSRPSTRQPNQSEIVILDTLDTGGRQPLRPLLDGGGNDTSAFWTPDGAHVFFLRNSAQPAEGKDGWVVPMTGGSVTGEPKMVAPNLPQYPVSLADDGALQVVQMWRLGEVYTTSIDLSGSRQPEAPVRISRTEIDNHVGPAWSPDGTSIAYFTTSPSPIAGGVNLKTLTIQDVASGQARQVPTRLAFLSGYSPQWFPGGESVIVWGADHDPQERVGYYRVNLRTGEGDAIVVHEGAAPEPGKSQLSADGQSFFYSDVRRGIVVRSLESLSERIILPPRKDAVLGRLGVSRDGTIALVCITGRSPRMYTLEVLGPWEAEPRVIQRASTPEMLEFQAWTPDGQDVLYLKGMATSATSPLALWAAPIAGGEPRNLHFSIAAPMVPGGNGLSLHPRGQRIVYPERSDDVWELWIKPLPLERLAGASVLRLRGGG